MAPKSNLNKLFPPKTFNDSTVSSMLITREKNIYVITRDNESKTVYDTFDELFGLYLNKLPSNSVKRIVTNLFNKRLIFLGTSTASKNDAVFTRLFLPTNKLNGIVLDSNVLDIDVTTGETSNIDDCVYAVYHGLLRASLLTNKDYVSKNTDLHLLVITYIFRVFLKIIGMNSIYNEKQKKFIHMACTYIFYRHFFNYRHPMALSYVNKLHDGIFDKQEIKEFIQAMKDITKYSSTKDIPKLLIDLNIYHGQPSSIMIKLLETLGNSGIYSLIGGLDQLISMIILNNYPTNLFPKSASVNQKIQEEIEKIVITLVEKIQYQQTKLLNP